MILKNNNYLDRVHYFDSSNIIAWGRRGELIKSTDGGVNWKFQQVENFARDSMSIDTNWFFMSFRDLSWPDLYTIFIGTDSGFFYKFFPSGVSVDDKINIFTQSKIHPNPVSNGNPFYFYIKDLPEGLYSLEIMDILGNTVFLEESYFSSATVLQRINSDFSPGIYFLNLKSENIIVAQNKIIIQ